MPPTASALKIHSAQFASLPFTAAADYTIGEIEKIDSIVGFVVGKDGKAVDYSEDANAVLFYQAEKCTLNKSVTSGQNSWAVGDTLYVDEAEKAITNAASGNIKCGVALQAQVAGDTECLLHFDGMLGLA